jgi:hypothetical protein
MCLVMPLTHTGYLEPGNQFQTVLRSATESTTLVATRLSNTLVSIALPANLSVGPRRLFAETTQPAARSRDSVQINVAALPTAELTTAQQALLTGDSTQVVVTLTGTPPWRFSRWDGQPVQASASPYTGWFRAVPQGNFRLDVSGLSDANCASGTSKNTLVLSLILGSEPPAGTRFTVAPNPTTGRVVVDMQGNKAIAMLQVHDLLGRVVQQVVNTQPIQKQEANLGTLPSGTYLLRVLTTRGQWLVWNVLKQ